MTIKQNKAWETFGVRYIAVINKWQVELSGEIEKVERIYLFLPLSISTFMKVLNKLRGNPLNTWL